MEFLFSVFTPTYNRANTIGRTYEYLCKQTLRSFEWIIVCAQKSGDTHSG